MERQALLSLGGSSYSNVTYNLGSERITDETMQIIAEDITCLKSLLNDYVFNGRLTPQSNESSSEVKTEAKAEVVIPEWCLELKPEKCSKCGSTNLVFLTGISAKTNKEYFNFKCEDCKNAHFVNQIKPTVEPQPETKVTESVHNSDVHCKQCNGTNMKLDKKGYMYNGSKYDIYNCLDCPPQKNKNGYLTAISTWVKV